MLQLLKASAGSGKTYSLARQYIELLLKNADRYAYRHILAVTFTNKATDEMKSRILKELHIMSSAPAESDYKDYFVPSVFQSVAQMQEKAQRVLHDILHDYSAFAVSTIDRFFQQALKAFSREIGHFSSYQVELDKDSLVAESVDRVLDSLTEDDSGILSWLTSNVLEQIESGERYDLDANLKSMAFRLMHPQRQDVLEASGMDADVLCSKERLALIRKRCREIMSAFRTSLKQKARAALDILEQAQVNPKDSSYGFLMALYDFVDLPDNAKVEKPSNSFFMRAADSELWFSKAKSNKLLPLVYPLLESPLNDFCSLWDKEYRVYNTASILDDQIYGLGVASELSKTFSELMKEKNVLCLDDSNVLLRKIIDDSDAPFIYEKLGVRYEHFLLDEFQDTSQVQWQNFRPLLQNSQSQGFGNLIVGDVKQSIYRWRGSDWKLLDRVIPTEFSECAKKVLDTNYRSLANIVNFNSSFFSEAAEALNDQILAQLPSGFVNGSISDIYADVGQKVSKKDKPGGNVKFSFCKDNDQLSEILAEIDRARQAGARYSDIAILVRSNDSGEKVATFLIGNSIPVVTDDSLKVKNSLTVRQLVSLMSYLDNPDNTVASYLADVLKVEMTDGTTSLIDMAESLFRCILKSDEEQQWKGELLHIQSFMDCLSEYVSSNGNNLRGFLNFWETENPSISSPASSDSIRIMTIHKSKGLDFPYVILPFAENIIMYKGSGQWSIPVLEGTPLEGIAEGVYDVTLNKSSVDTLFAEDYRQETFLQCVDNMNILYVAMTRAALGMHIIAKVPSAKFLSAISNNKALEFTDFSQVLFWYLNRHRTDEGFAFDEDDQKYWFELGQMARFDELRKTVLTDVQEFPIAEGLEFPSIPLNSSVSDDAADTDVRIRGRLKFSADSLDFFKDDEAGLSASSRIRGIVLHDILSQVKVPEDIPGAIAEAEQKGLLTAQEASVAGTLLKRAVDSVKRFGWFDPLVKVSFNEVSIIDTDGHMYRPDRVIVNDDKVMIVDYKFGHPERKYERQVRQYMDIWRRMGHSDVEGYIWYVDEPDERKNVVCLS